jgi:outer membrane immunogenic protein
LGGIAALAFTGTAIAADVPIRGPIYKAAPQISLWEGVYIGVHGGYAWAANDTVLGGVATNFRPDGGFGGIQLGYNRHLSPNWILGYEIDVSIGDLHGRRPVVANTGFFDVNAFGTARTRLGYAAGPWLLYATAGAAWADTNVAVPAAGLRFDRPQIGYTVGAGIEYAFAPRWSMKLEYLYADLDTTATNAGATTDLTMSTVRLGLNYRFANMPSSALGYDAPVSAFPTKAPTRYVLDWSGPYIGVHAGYGFGNFDATATALDPSGGFGGIQSGYNWQVSRNWVVGIESDSSWGSINDTVGASNVDVDAMGTVRARLGYAMDRWMVYGTGGLAWAHADAAYNAGTVNDRFYLGWAAGAGIEYLITPRWSAKLEYIYSDFGKITDNADTANLSASTIKVGVNYRASILELIGWR